MVTDASDYQVPKPGMRLNPLQGTDFIKQFAGIIVVISLLWLGFQYATNRVGPFIGSTLSNVSGGALSPSGGGGSAWDRW